MLRTSFLIPRSCALDESINQKTILSSDQFRLFQSRRLFRYHLLQRSEMPVRRYHRFSSALKRSRCTHSRMLERSSEQIPVRLTRPLDCYAESRSRNSMAREPKRLESPSLGDNSRF